MDSRSCPSELMKISAQEHVACCRRERRLLVSASHMVQAGNDQFIKKNEAHIMNRKKQREIGARKGMCTCLTSS